MSSNTIPGNSANFPALVHKIENGDPVDGPTVQLTIEEIVDRTASLKIAYERNYFYTPAGSTSQTFVLDLTSVPGLTSAEFILIGGGQAGGNAATSQHGHGGLSGSIQRIHIPFAFENATASSLKSFSIRCGAGGQANATTSRVNGDSGAATYLTYTATGAILAIARGGGNSSETYPTVSGYPYLVPSPALAPWPPFNTAYIDYLSSKLADEIIMQGGVGGFAMRGFSAGGPMGTVSPVLNSTGGLGAGAGGGGGILTSGSTAPNSQGSGGHGGYPSPAIVDSQIGNAAGTLAAALGGRGANGCAFVRVFYRTP